ncbi:hypothetical protein LAZ67_3004821 [Cordylochernes scorpioides]|uniref:Uncharacterized protein n=1 Tax=Cordylochernes scorpioides TaxID=51811 RepID=A0ABY6KAK5_9ARAC|nr:hypothetical protein LAZ67_3004821 [Cordylochernes scorpioides]
MVRRWRSWFLEGRQNVHDDERSGSPVTATDNAAVAAVRKVVEADRRVTIDEILIRLPPGIEIRRSSIGTIIIVTGDESWVHHSTPETKRQSMVWKKPEESAPKRAKVTISAGKVMAMENFKWEIFTHPPYSPELAPSDFYLYPALKWHLGGKHFANDDEVQAEVNHWLRRQDTAWYNSENQSQFLLVACVPHGSVCVQSSCASTDILVIIVVGFLTLLRGYSVLCVISYYQKAKNSEKDNFVKDLMAASDATDITGESLKDMDEYIPRPLLMDYSKKLPTTLQRDRGERSVPATLRRERGGGVAPSVVSTIDGHNEVKIQASDMPVEMQKAAVSSAHQALQLYSTEKLIAESIKQDFDRLYQPTWHCIAGRNWGSCVTHSRRCYVRMACRDMTIMLYRST